MSFVPQNRATHLTVVATCLLLTPFTRLSAAAATKTPASHPIMPIAFEQNQGQASPDIKFISRGASGVLSLSASEMTLRAPGKAAELRLTLRGASPSAALQGAGEAGGTVNYFYGNDPSQWVTNIPSYSQVTYKSVYPGVDLVVYGNNNQFESDFVIAREADPSAIALQTNGNADLRKDGSLLIHSANGAFQLHRPTVYQVADNGERLVVDCHYTVKDKNNIGFALASYDHSKSLIIDPVLSYSSYLGGTATQEILAITGDLYGNVYVAGQTTSTDFPTQNSSKAPIAGGHDCFVSKFDPTGQHLVYTAFLGGSADDKCVTMDVNFSGEVFVGGSTKSTNFPTTQNPLVAKNTSGGATGFVAHFDCTGSKLIFSTYLGGNGGEYVTGLDLDLASNVYVTGGTSSTNFPVTKGAYQSNCDQCGSASAYYPSDAFLSKISADGSHFIYSTLIGGSNFDFANGVAVDLLGSAYIAGETHSPDFPTTKSGYQTTYKKGAIANAFVTKFSPDGSTLVYSTYMGGSLYDSARSIALDLFGNAYITGSTVSSDFPTMNPVRPFTVAPVIYTSSGVFVQKLNATGSALYYSTFYDGTGYDYPFGISVDLFGNATVVGETNSTDFPTKAPIQAAKAGGYDAFVVNFAPNGTVNYATYLGGAGDDLAVAVYSSPFGCVWLGGYTFGTGFPTKNPYQAAFTGSEQGFFADIHP